VNLVVDEDTIKDFWQNAPVDEAAVGGFKKDFESDWTAFFTTYDQWRYQSQGHILSSLDQFNWNGKRVLEIGLGQGADSEQLIRRGARWSGIDLTAESVERLRMRLQIRNLPYEELHQGSALKLPFKDNSFDAVYSHGVLHHIPEIDMAQSEIRRVLKPNGRLVIMVYARHSLNYHFGIKIMRRIGLVLVYVLPIPLHGIYAEHKRLARENGLLNYLKLSNFLSRSTDGPHNPYSKVYDTKEIMKDFPDFEIVRTFKRWMHAPPLPVHALPGESLLGWHLWAELKPKVQSQL
jgi:ubiquinone/menaquinone biosynthesis C-methylase UbiE